MIRLNAAFLFAALIYMDLGLQKTCFMYSLRLSNLLSRLYRWLLRVIFLNLMTDYIMDLFLQLFDVNHGTDIGQKTPFSFILYITTWSLCTI